MCIGRQAETRRWIKVGLTIVQRRRWWTDVEPTLIQRLLVSAEYCVCLWDRLPIQPLQANTHTAGQSHAASVVSMLAHRLRRWPNIWSVLMSGRRRRLRANIQTTLDHSRSHVVYSTGSLVLRGRSKHWGSKCIAKVTGHAWRHLTDMADIVLYMIGIDASFISVFIWSADPKLQNLASWCNKKSYS